MRKFPLSYSFSGSGSGSCRLLISANNTGVSNPNTIVVNQRTYYAIKTNNKLRLPFTC